MRRFVRDCGLSLFFGLIFLLALAGQAWAGWKAFNAEQSADQLARLTLPEYLTSASFAGDVAENWQSEYLQFLLYIVVTVWLLQRGSPESKEMRQGRPRVGPGPEDRQVRRRRLSAVGPGREVCAPGSTRPRSPW